MAGGGKTDPGTGNNIGSAVLGNCRIGRGNIFFELPAFRSTVARSAAYLMEGETPKVGRPGGASDGQHDMHRGVLAPARSRWQARVSELSSHRTFRTAGLANA